MYSASVSVETIYFCLLSAFPSTSPAILHPWTASPNEIQIHPVATCTIFLVACTRLYNPLCPSVGWSVGLSVCRSHFTFFYDFISLTSRLLPKWSSDLKYGPCPPARDFGSRVSSLVSFLSLLPLLSLLFSLLSLFSRVLCAFWVSAVFGLTAPAQMV